MRLRARAFFPIQTPSIVTFVSSSSRRGTIAVRRIDLFEWNRNKISSFLCKLDVFLLMESHNKKNDCLNPIRISVFVLSVFFSSFSNKNRCIAFVMYYYEKKTAAILNFSRIVGSIKHDQKMNFRRVGNFFERRQKV